MLGEDIEDHGGAVDDLDADDVLERTTLGGGELAVDDDRVGARGDDDLGQLRGLAGPEISGRIGVIALLDEGVQDLGAGGLGECCELGQRGLRVLGGAERPGAGSGRSAAGQVQADEHDPLQADPAVLDLANVLELGTEAGDTADTGARLPFQGAVVIGLTAGISARGGGQCRPGAREDTADDVLGGGPIRARGVRGDRARGIRGAGGIRRVVGRVDGGVMAGRAMSHEESYSYARRRPGAETRRARPACRARMGADGAVSRHRLNAYG